MRPIIIFGADKIVPKARPRFRGSAVSLPKNYKADQQRLKNCFKSLKGEFRDEGISFGSPVSIQLFYSQVQGDGDNIVGSIMDSMVKAGIIKDDSRRYVPRVESTFVEDLTSIQPGAKWVLIIERHDPDLTTMWLQRFIHENYE